MKTEISNEQKAWITAGNNPDNYTAAVADAMRLYARNCTPPPPSKEVKSAEEIPDSFKRFVRMACNGWKDNTHPDSDEQFESDIFRIVQHYAQQFQSTPISQKEHALKFAEWVSKNNWQYDNVEFFNWTSFKQKECCTTEMLYERFLTELSTLNSL